MKNLIILFDGTSNRAENKDGDVKGLETNVRKCVDIFVDNGDSQFTWYDEGVGTDWVGDVGGMAFGLGVNKNLKQGYEQLVRWYEPGDKIFILGFSRGAYTARALAGVIDEVGVVDFKRWCDIEGKKGKHRHLRKAADDAFDVCRAAQKRANRVAQAEAFKQKYSHADSKVEMIGAWDTVGALGLQGEWHDIGQTKTTKAIYHALAIDEYRKTFLPDMVERLNNPDADQTVEEVWFVGCHSNIGGGYAGEGLSNIPLHWIVNKAKAHGAIVDNNALNNHKRAVCHEIRMSHKEGVTKILPEQARDIPPGSTMHWTVNDRLACTTYDGPQTRIGGDLAGVNYDVDTSDQA